MCDDDPLMFVYIALYCAAHGTPVGDTLMAGDRLPDDVVVLGEFGHTQGVGWHMVPFSARWGGRQARHPDPRAQQHIAPDGSVVRLWGHEADRQLAEVQRASELAGADRNPVPGLRWRLRCPESECGVEVRRGRDRLNQQFDALAAHRVAAISLQGLQGR